MVLLMLCAKSVPATNNMRQTTKRCTILLCNTFLFHDALRQNMPQLSCVIVFIMFSPTKFFPHVWSLLLLFCYAAARIETYADRFTEISTPPLTEPQFR